MSGTERGTLAGGLLCSSEVRRDWWASFSIVQLQMLGCGGREAMVTAPLLRVADSGVTALLPWLPDFPPQEFPTTVSSLTSPGSLSPQSTAVLALGLLQSLNSSSQPLHLPGTCIPVWGTHGCSKDCLILVPFRLPQITCFTLSLKCFSSDSDNCPIVGSRPLLQFPHAPRAGPVLLTLLFSPWFLDPAEFCVVLYVLFHWSRTPVHSQLEFCMHFCVWRCIPDVSMERDVFHVHLLLRYLVLLHCSFDLHFSSC